MAVTTIPNLEVSGTRSVLKGTMGGLGGAELKVNESCIVSFGSVYRIAFRDNSSGTTGVYHECVTLDLTTGVDSDKRVTFFNTSGQITSSSDFSFDSSSSLLTIGSGGNYGSVQENASDTSIYSTDTMKLSGVSSNRLSALINEIGFHSGYSLLSIKQSTDDALGALNIRQSGDNNTWALFQDSTEKLNFSFATSASGADESGDFSTKFIIEDDGTFVLLDGSLITNVLGNSDVTINASSINLSEASAIILDSAGNISLESSVINCGLTHTGYGCVDIKQTVDNYLGGIRIVQNGTNDAWALYQDTDEKLIFGYANSASGGDDNADFNNTLRIDKDGYVFAGTGTSFGGLYLGGNNTDLIWRIFRTGPGGPARLNFRKESSIYPTNYYGFDIYEDRFDIYLLTGLYSNGEGYQDYSSTSTITGFSSLSTREIHTKKVGKTVVVWFTLEGVGSTTDTDCTFTVPYVAGKPFTNTYWFNSLIAAQDNTSYHFARAFIVIGMQLVYVRSNWNGGWSLGNTRKLSGYLVYHSV